MMHDVTVHAVAGPPVRHGQRPNATDGWHCNRSTPGAGRRSADTTVIVISAIGPRKPNTCRDDVRVLEEKLTHPTRFFAIMPSIRRSKVAYRGTRYCRMPSTAAIRPAETVMPRKTGAPSRRALRDAAKPTLSRSLPLHKSRLARLRRLSLEFGHDPRPETRNIGFRLIRGAAEQKTLIWRGSGLCLHLHCAL